MTDLTDPANPRVVPEPIDLWRNDGLTDYSHDVDVDANGIAWTSGRGGLLGYAVRERWRDPRTNTMRVAKPWDPILVAGGGIEGGNDGVAQPQTDFIHNAARPLDGTVHASGVADGNIVLMTEEDFTTPCNQGGRIVAADITDSLGGEPATNSTPAQPVSAERAERIPSDAGRPGHGGAHHGLLGALLRAVRLDRRGGLVRPGPAPDRRLQRPQPRQVGYYYVTGTAPTNPSSLLGTPPGAATCLPLRHGARDRDPAPEGRVGRGRETADGAVAAGEGQSVGSATRCRLDERLARLPALRGAVENEAPGRRRAAPARFLSCRSPRCRCSG